MKQLLEKWNRFLDKTPAGTRELGESGLSWNDLSHLAGLERVETIKRKPRRFAFTPVSILWCIGSLICVVTQQWFYVLGVTGAMVVLFWILTAHAPSYCPKCGREMDTKAPLDASIQFDVCKRCGCYSNLQTKSTGE